MQKSIGLLIFVLIFLFSITFAQTYGSFYSTGAAIGWSPRLSGMGGVSAALEGNIEASIYNPASIARLINSGFSFGYNHLGINPESLGFGGENISGMMISFGVPDTGLWASEIYYTRLSPQEELGVIYVENQLGYTIGKPIFQNLSLGATFKKLWITLPDPYTADGFGLDVGVILKFTPNIKIGFSAQNLYNTLYWNNGETSYNEPIKPNIKAGVAWQNPNLILAVDIDFPDLYIHVGGEYSFGDTLFLRFGWNVDSPTFGIGVKKENISVDYSLLYSLNLGGFYHRVGLNMYF